MKLYRGFRSPNGAVVTVEENGKRDALNPRNDLRDHSPNGFEWAYRGSGPAQLALALLADALGDDERALNLYQRFKEKKIACLAGAWCLTDEGIRATAATLEDADNAEKLANGCGDK